MSEFKVSLVYKASSGTAKTIPNTPKQSCPTPLLNAEVENPSLQHVALKVSTILSKHQPQKSDYQDRRRLIFLLILFFTFG